MPKRPELSLPSPEGEYEVGYRKPPAKHRFARGRSGNPRGRPRGKKTELPALNEERLKSIVIAEAYRTLRVTDNGEPVTISMAEAVIRSIVHSAAKGQQRAQRLFVEMLTSTERDYKLLHDEWLKTAIEYKVGWEEELERRKRLGIIAPDPIPHPDDIIIHMNTGQVQVKGPFTKEEKAVWDRLRARKAECQRSIAENLKTLRRKPNHKHAEILRDEIRHECQILEMIGRVIKD